MKKDMLGEAVRIRSMVLMKDSFVGLFLGNCMESAETSPIPNFSVVKDFADIQRRFFQSASEIIKNYVLHIKGKCFRPTSLELYLKLHNRPEVWFDRSTDSGEDAKEQFNRGTWYIRQRKGPSRWRIDITAGNIHERVQAGILIRQLDGLGGLQPGPATALHRIVRGAFGTYPWHREDLELIRQIHGKKIDGSDGSPLILKRRSVALSATLVKGKRFNIPKSESKNIEGILIRDAHLRASIFCNPGVEKVSEY